MKRFMVCYLGHANQVTFERSFDLYHQARDYIKDVTEEVFPLSRFIIDRGED